VRNLLRAIADLLDEMNSTQNSALMVDRLHDVFVQVNRNNREEVDALIVSLRRWALLDKVPDGPTG
jgi:hypothetical protein